MLKKRVKKQFVIFSILVFAIAFFVPSFTVEAKTIQDYRNELASVKKQQDDANNNSKEIQDQIDNAKEQINQITIKISEANKQQEQLNQEIQDLNDKIDTKEEQIKDLVSFYQLSTNENFYLKYLFGSDSFEDFIYRFSVIEQLSTKSNELIDEMNDLIKQNKDKVTELDNTKEELNILTSEVNKQIGDLGNQKTSYTEAALSYDDQIKSLQQSIDYYVDLGCDETESLTSCTSQIPSAAGFIKPLSHGMVTDEYGWRLHPTQGIWKLHSGIDLGVSEGTEVYAAAPGVVSHVFVRLSCGGNQVVINHNINGTSYTTVYMHLLNYTVSAGDIVSAGELIGHSGGQSTSTYYGGYDACTTGGHLHFTVATGHYYGTDDESYYDLTSHLINPRDVVEFPALYRSW